MSRFSLCERNGTSDGDGAYRDRDAQDLSVEILDSLASGAVKHVGLIRNQGLIGGLRVNLREIMSAATGLDDLATTLESAKIIGVRYVNIIALSKHKFLKTPKSTIIPPVYLE